MPDKFSSILPLLYFANARVSTIRMVLRYSADRRLVEFASGRYIERISAKPLYLTTDDIENENIDTEAERYEYRWQVWWQRNLLWRITYLNLSDQTTQTDLIEGDKSSQKLNTGINRALEVNKAATEFAFLDPSFLLSSHDLALLDEEHFLGRKAYRLLARPRPDREAALDKLFWSSADFYELVVDAKLGILLSYTAHLNQQPFAVVTTEELDVNEPKI